MPVVISMLRGVNVGGHNLIKMDPLRALYESLGLQDPATYVQSGNVIFKTKERDVGRLAPRIQNEIERRFGFRPGVILRTSSDLRDVIKELRITGRELYIYFPAGIGRSKLPPLLDRILKNSSTARNWNTVTRLLAMAEKLEASR